MARMVRRGLKMTTEYAEGAGVADYIDRHHEHEKLFDFIFTGEINVLTGADWIGPTELAGMPSTVDVCVENKDATNAVRLYYDYTSTRFQLIDPGKMICWPNLAWTAGNEWRLETVGASSLCKVTILGNY